MGLKIVSSDRRRTQVLNRLQTSKGAAVASASTLTLGGDGNLFSVSGTTATKYIATAGWSAGAIVFLEFQGIVVVHDDEGTTPSGAADITLATGGDFTSAAGDLLGLVYNGTVWKEFARTVI